jgi:hypothetical protein
MTLFVRHLSPAQQHLWSPVQGDRIARQATPANSCRALELRSEFGNVERVAITESYCGSG